MAAAPYEVGDRVKIIVTFTDEDLVNTSPTTLTAEYRGPTDTTPTPIVPVEIAPGVFTITLPTFDEGGVWRWYCSGTAGVIAADQGTIAVDHKITV